MSTVSGYHALLALLLFCIAQAIKMKLNLEILVFLVFTISLLKYYYMDFLLSGDTGNKLVIFCSNLETLCDASGDIYPAPNVKHHNSCYWIRVQYRRHLSLRFFLTRVCVWSITHIRRPFNPVVSGIHLPPIFGYAQYIFLPL